MRGGGALIGLGIGERLIPEALIRLFQRYRRLNQICDDYHSPLGDYRATIVLAASGFAAVYPGLWEIET